MHTIRLLTGLVALASFNAQASTHVRLKMRLTLNGKTIPSEVITDFGKTASLIQQEKDGSGFEITATPTLVIEGKDAVHLKFVISEIHQGKKSVVSEPRVSVIEGQEAVVQQRDGDVATMELSVVPTVVESERL